MSSTRGRNGSQSIPDNSRQWDYRCFTLDLFIHVDMWNYRSHDNLEKGTIKLPQPKPDSHKYTLGGAIQDTKFITKCVPMHDVCRMRDMPHMDMDQGNGVRRLPTSDARRTELRDAKMWRRETERQVRTGNRSSRCPCTLCLFGKPLLRATQAKHIRDYGRHPAKRLQEEVNSSARTTPPPYAVHVQCTR